MRIEFAPFHHGDIFLIDVQDEQKSDVAGMTDPAYGAQLERGVALTAWGVDRPVVAAGVVPVTARFAVAWALFSTAAIQSPVIMLSVTRKARTILRLEPYERVEMTVKAGHAGAERWARALGFTCETPRPLRKRGPNGEDVLIYGRVRE